MALWAAKGVRGGAGRVLGGGGAFRRRRPGSHPVDCAGARGGAFAVVPAFCPTAPHEPGRTRTTPGGESAASPLSRAGARRGPARPDSPRTARPRLGSHRRVPGPGGCARVTAREWIIGLLIALGGVAMAVAKADLEDADVYRWLARKLIYRAALRLPER